MSKLITAKMLISNKNDVHISVQHIVHCLKFSINTYFKTMPIKQAKKVYTCKQ